MSAAPDTIPAWLDGTLTPVDKIEVHRRGLRHQAVSVFVLGPRGILIQRRAASKYHTPGLWANTCCTHPHWQEPPETCARRRLAEELGIEGLPLEWREQLEYRAEVGNGMTEHEVVEVYVGQTKTEIPVFPNPEEVWETEWVALPDLTAAIAQEPERFTPWLRIYLRDHSTAIFGRG